MEETFESWVPDHNDFSLGRCLMIMEDYSKTVEQIWANPKYNLHYGALLYSVLSLREKFESHKIQFNEFLVNNLWTSESINKNQKIVEEILKKYGFANRKIKTVFSIAKEWKSLNLTERIREDKKKELGFKLREEIIEKMYGTGYKFASLFLRMSGYENLVPVDTWAMKYVESRGFRDRHKRSGLKPKQYLKYEKKLTEYAKEFDVSPALFQATIYAKWSTWKKDSKVTPEYS